MAVLSMSKQEFSRLEVLLRVQSGHLRVSDACVLIGLQRRQVFRLLRGLKQDGATSLLSKHRGKPSNHRLPAEVRTLALSIVRERYALARHWRRRSWQSITAVRSRARPCAVG
jgi:Winged helix-turn helix